MTRDRVVRWAAGAVAVAVAVWVWMAWGRPPQMGADAAVFHTVDALYTAVRTRDGDKVARCDGRLKEYRAAGKLPAAAGDALDGVIATARAGKWESAARSLYDFMDAQRREGATGPVKVVKSARR